MTTSSAAPEPAARLWRWTHRHPWLAGSTALILLAGVVTGGVWAHNLIAAPALACGAGMAENTKATACIGVDLDSSQLTPAEPAGMAALETDLQLANNTMSGDYVSVVLLLDLSPVPGVDTVSYPDLVPNIEGAITAVWQANHTAAYGSLPKVKLFLANMGSENADWSAAVDRITADAAANHVTSVIGLGQSTERTRAAAAKLTEQAHLPVIGATVTGDTMNLDPRTNALLTGFFRVAPTNTDSVAAAARYISNVEPDRTHVAIVQDNVLDDDYTETLRAAADRAMPLAHQFPFTSPSGATAGLTREQELIGQFKVLDLSACAVAPKVVYFAGRGADLGAFVQSWT
jgi:hypothetical protein